MADRTPTRAEYLAATEANRRAYDAIHGNNLSGPLRAGAGSQKVYERVKAKYDKDPKKYADEYKTALADYNADVAAYRKTQDAKNVMTKAMKAVKTAATAVKTKETLTKDYASAVNKLTTAITLAPSKGQDQLQTAYDNAKSIFDALKKAGGNPAPLPTVPTTVLGSTPVKTPDAPPVASLSEWDKYTVNTKYGTVTAPGGNPVYFANVKGANGKPAIQGFTSMSEARTAFLKNYATDAQITGLKNQLVKSGYLKANQINTTEWLGSVDTMLAEYTYATMISYKYQGVKTPSLITSWLPTRAGTGTGTGTGTTSQAGTFPVTTTSLSTRLETNKEADEFFQDWLTRPATPEEKDAYFAAVNKAESLAVNKRSTTRNVKGEVTNVVDQGGFLTDGDRLIIAAKIAKPSLANINIDALLAGGGKLAQNINDLNAYAASMGLPKDNKYILQVASEMLDADGLTLQKEKIKNEAMLHFKPLASHIQSGGTVQTAAQVYQKIRSNILGTLETPVTDITKDKGLMAAMGGTGLMNLNDWEKMLFKDPLFAKSPYAHEQGASYVSTLLKSFGLMA